MLIDAVSYRVYVDGVLFDTVPGQESIRLAGLSAGTHSVQTSSVDAAGNESALSTATTVTVLSGTTSATTRRVLRGVGR